MAKTNRNFIANEYRDSDGYWIELVPGWQNGLDPGTHGIVESTKADAYSTLRSAKRCTCSGCTARLFDATLKLGMQVRIGSMARTDAIGRIVRLTDRSATVRLVAWHADGVDMDADCRRDELVAASKKDIAAAAATARQRRAGW